MTTTPPPFPTPLRGWAAQHGCIGYELTADLDFDTDDDGEADSGDDYWNSGNGWLPIGNTASVPFNAIFDGNRLHGHTISNLYINRPGTTGLGLFGYTGSSATIRNVELLDVSLTGHDDVGGLVGFNDGGTISNSDVSGSISGGHQVGGLAGNNQSGGSIENSQASGTVLGYRNAGGLVGANYDTISDSHATAAVTSEFPSTIEQAGGLVGLNERGTISNSYATGDVEGHQDIGGLVGKNDSGTIEENSYATGDVTGRDATTSTSERVGGLVGLNERGTISNSYATGRVEGHQDIGGLVGQERQRHHRREQLRHWHGRRTYGRRRAGGMEHKRRRDHRQLRDHQRKSLRRATGRRTGGAEQRHRHLQLCHRQSGRPD